MGALPGFPFLPNPGEQHRRRFVGRVLRDQLALEGALQDALPEAGGALEVGFDLTLPLHDYRKPPFDLGNDLPLFRQERDRKR